MKKKNFVVEKIFGINIIKLIVAEDPSSNLARWRICDSTKFDKLAKAITWLISLF